MKVPILFTQVLASDPSTRLLDGHSQMWTGENLVNPSVGRVKKKGKKKEKERKGEGKEREGERKERRILFLFSRRNTHRIGRRTFFFFFFC